MKELEIKQKDKLEISVKQQKQIQYDLINNIVPHNNHTIWKINKETLHIEKAKFLNTNFVLGGENKKEILIQDGFAYVSAMNKANALKKFKQGKNGSKDIIKEPLKLIL